MSSELELTPFQIYRMVTPKKNDETGEICEDLICVKCNAHINNETGELEETEKELFKIPIQDVSPVQKNGKIRKKCDMCKNGKRSLVFLIISLTLILPSFSILIYCIAEIYLHSSSHKPVNDDKKGMSIKDKLHQTFFSQFCAFCQSEISMKRVKKLQDARLVKMRKYVKNIPIQ